MSKRTLDSQYLYDLALYLSEVAGDVVQRRLCSDNGVTNSVANITSVIDWVCKWLALESMISMRLEALSGEDRPFCLTCEHCKLGTQSVRTCGIGSDEDSRQAEVTKRCDKREVFIPYKKERWTKLPLSRSVDSDHAQFEKLFDEFEEYRRSAQRQSEQPRGGRRR